jgi:hypothetical protein
MKPSSTLKKKEFSIESYISLTTIDAFHNYELKPYKDIFPLVFKRVIENIFTPVFHQSLEIQTSKSFMLVAKNS